MTASDQDLTSRELIRNDMQTNFMVEAAAGTGKTTCIVQRMVNLIASGNCDIDNLVAVTFTRKASAELRQRFHAELRRAAESERSLEEVERLSDAVQRIEYAFVATFHSFCSTLLRERPIEFRVDPAFRDIDESEDQQIRDEAWHLFLSDLYSNQDKRLDRLHELGLKTNDLKRCLDRYAEFPDIAEWPHSHPESVNLEAIHEETRAYIEHMRAISPQFPVDRSTDKLMARYENIVRAADNSDWRVDCEFFDLLELFDTTHGAVLKWWHDKDVAKAEKQRFVDFGQTAKQHLKWWHQHRYAFVIELLHAGREVYDRLRRASGGLNYQDLLLRVAEGLKTQPKLRRYFQRRFSAILVDEFQDTDPVQAEILAFLTAENHAETNWHRCVPQPGALFLVGDPKQSIYRFRRADIVTYNRVKQLFEDSGGKILTLSKNFRSDSILLDWVNPVFRTLFANGKPKYSPLAVDMELGRESATPGDVDGIQVIRIPDDLYPMQAVAYEADLIARYIHACIAAKKRLSRSVRQLQFGQSEFVEPGDFLIVARRKRHLHLYGEALNRYGINSDESGGNAFQAIEELSIIVNCLRAIDDARNPIPYVGVLRGTLFGFGDAELYELKRAGGRFSYAAELPQDLSADLQARFQDVNSRLAKYRTWFRTMPFTTAFTRVVTDLGLLARCSSHEDGNVVAGGFLKSIEWIRAASWDFDSATDVITYLEELLESSETDGCDVLAQTTSSVRIMNLHKAKGLEAPIVFLANPYGMNFREPDFHIDRSGDRSMGYMSIKKPKGQYHTQPMAEPSNWDQFQDEEAQFEQAEEMRLLYVACTRAASQLVISVPAQNRAKYSPWSPLYDHLADCPELEVPRFEPAVESTKDLTERMTLNQAKHQIESAWEQVSQPSYQVVAAKSAAASDTDARPSWRASGDYGEQWGSAIHALLEAKMNDPERSVRRLAERLATQYELGAGRVDEILATIDAVASSDIWERAQQGKNLQTEVSFESATTDSAMPTITRGVIDLCFEEPDGWVIVDYKTDDVTESTIDDALLHYRGQLETYAEYWTKITGRPTIETGLFFTKLATYRTVG